MKLFLAAWLLAPQEPPNTWVELRKDPAGGRRGSSIRWAPEAGAFLLWGFMDHDPDLPQEHPVIEVPEYDMVSFDPAERQWRPHFPRSREADWKKKLPPATVPRTYSGITTGSERTVLRGLSGEGGVARPDLNIVFDQAAYHPPTKSLVYFTGGLTAAYDVASRRWTDLAPPRSPPPVLGGSLAHDPVNDEIVLFGGGHVAEPGPDGKLSGFTGTWVYSFKERDWRPLKVDLQPPPRMCTRMVTDAKNQAIVLFGGDGQSRFLADTWIYDLKARAWRASRAPGGPEARAGHFTVYDPETGWVILGGGYNRRDLADMWAYDAAKDAWQRLAGEVPAAFYIAADLAPERRTILLVANSRRPGDTMTCNILFPVRTTYGYRIDPETILKPGPVEPQKALPKRAPAESPERREAQAQRLGEMPVNQWVHLADPGRVATTRTWGSATFDSDRGLLLYWGGGHCGYEGSDVDAYDLEAHTWRGVDPEPEYPERLWNHAARLAGVTFSGAPWCEHGRKTYAYDPVSRRMILALPIRLTTGYEPAALADFPAVRAAAPDAIATTPSSYLRYAAWSYDPATGRWEILGGAPAGVDTLVTTRHGVMGVNVSWRQRLNDAGYNLPWSPSQPPEDKAIWLLDASRKRWERLSEGQPSPQNLYEMTGLAYDSKRDRVLLHGAGQRRDELWSFEIAARRWKKLEPGGIRPPSATREAVYLPADDVALLYGPAPEDRNVPALWIYVCSEVAWRRADIPPMTGIDPRARAGQNRAMVYDSRRDLVLAVLGTGGDQGKAAVFALRYSHGKARFLPR
jgi:hypothetical protein